MSDQVVTELVIDADTSGADRYSQAMDSVGQATSEGVGSAAQMSLALAGVGAAAIAALAGLRAFVDYVGHQSQALVDMADHAELAGMSVKQFQETLFAAMSKGVSEKDFSTGLDKISSDLSDASRGATQFGQLLEKNDISIKDSNGALITTKQALGDIANLMSQATPAQQQAIAKIVGLSQSWIPFLKQGADAIEDQKKKAADLGIIIDDSTIAKAKEFNDQWKVAVAAWDLQFKASLASILPLLVQLAGYATTVINGIGQISSTALRLTTPVDQQTTAQLNETINDYQRLIELMQKAGEQSFRATNLKGALGLPEDADLKAVQDGMQGIINKYDELQGRLVVTRSAGAGINLPDFNSAKDQLERYLESVDRQIAKTKADTETVGQNTGAVEAARVEAGAYEAALRAGFTDLEKYADQFKNIAEQAGAATLALEKAKVASQISFARQTALLSPEDVAIANQLKGIYGNDVPAALASTEAAAMRVNNAIKDAKDDGVQFAQSFVNGMMQGKSAMDALSASLQQLATKLADKAIVDLISGNYVQAGIEGIAAIGAFIAGKNTKSDDAAAKAAKDLQDAQIAWHNMAQQVLAFNAAAKGFDLGPLTNELQSLHNTVDQLQAAAAKAHDTAGAASSAAEFNNAVVRITQEFRDGKNVLTDTATDYQKALTSLNDEAVGLAQELALIGFSGLGSQIHDQELTLIDHLTAQFVKSFSDGLTARLNTANGQDYLNSAAALVNQHAQDLLEAQQLGISISLVSQTFAAEAQKIVNDANLTGDAFKQFIAQFPELTGVVTQAAAAIRSASDIAGAQQSAADRQFAASNDNSSYAGAIAAAVRADQQQQAAEIAAGGQAINDLVAAQQAELNQIYWKFQNQQLADAQGFADRIFAATNDASTYQGAIAQAVRKDQQEQASYIAAGGQDINDLVAAQQAELNQIYWKFTNQAIAAAQAATDAAASRLKGYQDTLFNDTNDTSTLQGQLAAFDRQAQAQMLAEQAAGGQDMVALEQIQAAERQSVIDKFNRSAVDSYTGALNQVEDATKQFSDNIVAYLEQLKTGSNSTLSPKDKLAAAQDYFNKDLSASGSGDAAARARLTQDATTLLDLAKAFYASSTGYSSIYGATVSSLQQIAGLPITGLADGGLVGNGIMGVDSVLAKFAGGGNVALAGGEFVMPAAQTQANLPQLYAMRSGAGSNDNGAQIAQLGQQLVQAMAGISMSETATLKDENSLLRAQLARAVSAIEANRPAPARPNVKRAS